MMREKRGKIFVALSKKKLVSLFNNVLVVSFYSNTMLCEINIEKQ